MTENKTVFIPFFNPSPFNCSEFNLRDLTYDDPVRATGAGDDARESALSSPIFLEGESSRFGSTPTPEDEECTDSRGCAWSWVRVVNGDGGGCGERDHHARRFPNEENLRTSGDDDDDDDEDEDTSLSELPTGSGGA